MAGLTPLGNFSNIVANVFNEFQEKMDNEFLQLLQYAGEDFVNAARDKNIGNYQDRTLNLRSSIGYIILKDGKIVDKDFEGKNEGKSQGVKVANEVGTQYPSGYVLIGVAGMEYAAYVEAKSFDVITTASEIAEQTLKELLIKLSKQ